jgi:hypothetical protein
MGEETAVLKLHYDEDKWSVAGLRSGSWSGSVAAGRLVSRVGLAGAVLGDATAGRAASWHCFGWRARLARCPGGSMLGRWRKGRLGGLQGTDGRGTRCLGVARGRGTWPGGSRGEAWRALDGAWRGQGCTARG